MAKEKGVQVSATVTKEIDQVLEDHRWSVRLTKTELVRVAILEYIENHGLTVAGDNQVEAGGSDHPPAA